MKGRCFGVDLGTTKSAIALVRDGAHRPELIAVDGAPIVPSAVWYPPPSSSDPSPRPVVGAPALRQAALTPDRVLRSTKRHMGTTQEWAIDDRVITPVDAAAAILTHLADAAEQAVGERPRRVVITVPAWFTVAQRHDTRRAGEAAGLEVVRLLSEPTAAALAHAHGRDARRTALVYDFGGGTFDVSLIDQDGPVTEVRASHGDTWLGGDDVDEALLTHVLGDLPAPLAAAAMADPVALARLREALEAAKCALSTVAIAAVRLPFWVTVDGAPHHLDHALAREDVEAAALPLFQRTLASVDAVLADVHRAPSDIADLLLVGGSSMMPLVQQGLFKRYGLAGDARVPPRHAVALGAAIHAAILDGREVSGVLVDVAPHALSVGMASGGVPGYPTHFVCEVVTPRNAPLPARHTLVTRTGHPTQSRVRLPVFQGDHPDPRRNVILGEILLEGIPDALEGELFRPIHVELLHDLDGTVRIQVREPLSGVSSDGRLATDGAEVAALRASWEAFVAEHELTWGDPYGAAEPAAAGAPTPALLPEALALFDQLDAAAASWDAHPAWPDLRSIVARGRAALAAGDRAGGQAAWEAAQDRMFEEGIWL
jgi:molecular chaperone DnaK